MQIDAIKLKLEALLPARDVAWVPSLELTERIAILEALIKTNGDTSQAARLLGISRSSVYRRLDEMGI